MEMKSSPVHSWFNVKLQNGSYQNRTVKPMGF